MNGRTIYSELGTPAAAATAAAVTAAANETAIIRRPRYHGDVRLTAAAQ